MKTINKNPDEFLHPLWLGILILFMVITIIGLLCFLRRKFGSQICHLFNRLCCRNQLNNENHSKLNKHLSVTSSSNRKPTYIPAPSSPKLYRIVRNVKMSSVDEELPIENLNSNENNESDHAFLSRSNQDLTNDQHGETARKFYANMRQTNQSLNSASLENSSDEYTTNQLIKLNRETKKRKKRVTK